MPLSPEQIAIIQAARHVSGGRIPAALVAQLVAAGTPLEQLMLELIPVAQTYALPPISKFFVGAVSLGSSGALYFGANLEFPGQALSFTVHGEQAATAAAISFGESGIEKLAISAAPCGYCRQFLYELTTAARLQILLPGAPPALLPSLLPDAFGPGDLGVTAALMSAQDHRLSLVGPPAEDAVVEAALQAANTSYAPYSLSYAGVALRSRDGGIYTGSVAENAAFNPSLSPLEAAAVALVVNGGKQYAEITDAVLVEARATAVSQLAATKAVLASMTKAPLRFYAAAAAA